MGGSKEHMVRRSERSARLSCRFSLFTFIFASNSGASLAPEPGRDLLMTPVIS